MLRKVEIMKLKGKFDKNELAELGIEVKLDKTDSLSH
jgi:hypothetical protein